MTTPQTPRKRPNLSTTVVVSPSPAAKKPRAIRGYCEQRGSSGTRCCHKAEYEQRCQSCGHAICLGDCIKHFLAGWCHTRCEMDEKRGPRALFQDFQDLKRLEGASPNKLLKNEGEEEDQKTQEEENDGASVQSSAGGGENDVHLTAEQQAILDYTPTKPGEIIRIEALAGCGKTTTVAFLCNAICERVGPHAKILYVVFGRKTQEEARESGKFPKNAEIITTHALARRRLFGPGSNFVPIDHCPLDKAIDVLQLRAYAQRKFGGARETKRLDRITKSIGRNVISTLEKFQQSTDAKVANAHVPRKCLYQLGDDEMGGRWQWKKEVTSANYVSWANELFETIKLDFVSFVEMQRDSDQLRVGISFDAYLKMFQMQDRDSWNYGEYDAILVDEAQDMTPCQADLLWGRHGENNKDGGPHVYLVGDRHQIIYRFRGAGDAFGETNVSQEFPLQQSFRFGSSIAEITNTILRMKNSSVYLRGVAACDGSVTEAEIIERGVVLTRTRNGVYKYLEKHQSRKWTFYDVRQKIVTPNQKLLTLESFVRKQQKREKYGKAIQSDDSEDDSSTCDMDQSEVSSFRYKGDDFYDLQELIEICMEENDDEMLRNIFLVKDYLSRNDGQSISEHLNEIKGSYVADWRDQVAQELSKANGGREVKKESLTPQDVNEFDGVVFITAHKSKGLEFDTVLIYDDFQLDACGLEAVTSSRWRSDQLNLLYVAVSRAKKNLILHPQIHIFIDSINKTERSHASFSPVQQKQADLASIREEWELLWKIFEEDDQPIQSVESIPWPKGPVNNVFALESDMNMGMQRAILKKAYLRYHWDKFYPTYHDRLQQLGVSGTKCLESRMNEYFNLAKQHKESLQDVARRIGDH